MIVTKLDKAKQIVAALYNLPDLPDLETASISVRRDVLRLSRRTHKQLESSWRCANKILHDRAVSAGDLE